MILFSTQLLDTVIHFIFIHITSVTHFWNVFSEDSMIKNCIAFTIKINNNGLENKLAVGRHFGDLLSFFFSDGGYSNWGSLF